MIRRAGRETPTFMIEVNMQPFWMRITAHRPEAHRERTRETDTEYREHTREAQPADTEHRKHTREARPADTEHREHTREAQPADTEHREHIRETPPAVMAESSARACRSSIPEV